MAKKKFFLSIAFLGAMVVSATMFAAFEAHVINVTAKIENALKVDTEEIRFGTVFPQQEINKKINIGLSESFKAQDKAKEVDYIIRQKPKCAVTNKEGTVLIGSFETATGHVAADGSIDCGPAPRGLDPKNQKWGVLPSLCEFLSKHKEDCDKQQNEREIPAFHRPYTIVNGTIVWNEATGVLNKATGDINDTWIIDLKVPCFDKQCAQDWNDFVKSINPAANPNDFTLNPADESKIFGCDLWVEVTDIKNC